MTREQKIAKANRLKAKGIQLTVIAQSLGVPLATARSWALDTPWPTRKCYVCGNEFAPTHGNQKVCCGENARKRFHDNHSRGHCEDCGAELGARSGYPCDTRRRCTICARLEMARPVDERARQIEAWWADGLTLREIGANLGWTLGHVRQEIHRLREKGYDLPYRYATGKRAGRKFPEQVAA